MSKILAPIKQRILYYIDISSFEKIKFLESLGLSPSNFRGKSLYSEVGGDVIVKILAQDESINAEWLLMGKGDVFKSNEGKRQCGVDKGDKVERILEIQIEQLKEINVLLKDKISRLETENIQLYKIIDTSHE